MQTGAVVVRWRLMSSFSVSIALQSTLLEIISK